MLSIFIMYSNDRARQLELTLSCLREMIGYEKCQKILVVDGRLQTVAPPEFEVVQVPRINNKFSWASMWNAGICSSRYPKVLYLDSDRLLPNNYLQQVYENLADNQFLFTSLHFMVVKDAPLELCKEFLNQDPTQGLFQDERFQSCFLFEARHKTPLYGPGKGVMSGNTAFTKETYWRLKGVDPWYCGHGAYADTDLQLTALKAGCSFVDLKAIELHYHHEKINGEESLSNQDLKELALENFIYYCKKWQLPKGYAESLALKSNIKHPRETVALKWEDVTVDARESGRITALYP